MAAVEQAADGIVITDADGTIQYVNPAFTCLTGYSQEEVLGQNPRVLKSGKHADSFYQDLWSTIRSGRVWHGEVTNRRKDGSQYVEEMQITPIRNPGGVVVSYIAIKRDVSERRIAENERNFLAGIVESSQDAIISTTPSGTIATWNGAAEAIFGYNADEVIGRPASMIVAPERHSRLGYFMERVAHGFTLSQHETLCLNKDGKRFYASVTGFPVTDGSGRVVRLSAIVRDISAQKAAEAALRESEERFRLIADSCPAMLWVTDAQGETEFLNRAFRDFSGLDSEHTTRVEWRSVLHPDDAPEYLDAFKRAIEDRAHFRAEVRVRRGDGEWRWFGSYAAPRTSMDGGFVGHVGLSADITDRKSAEQALRESEERFRRQFADSSVVMLLIDAENSKIVDANDAAVRFYGYKREQLLAMEKSDINVLPESELRRLISTIQNEGQLFHFRHRLADGSVRDVEVASSRIRLRSRDVLHSIVFDVTERRRAEEAVKLSEARLRGITDAAQDAIVMMDPNGAVSYWNPAAEKMLGYRYDEAIGKHLHRLLVPERYVKSYEAAFPEFLATGRGKAVGTTLELQAKRSDGQEIIVDVSLSAIQLNEKWHAVGIMRDITKRKEIERALERSEEKFRHLAENIQEVFWIADPCSRRPLYISPAFKEVWGRSCESAYDGQASWFDPVHPDDLPEARRLFAVEGTGKAAEAQYRIRTPDGREKWIHDRAFPVYDENGEMTRIVGIAQDITERKRYEAELIRAREMADAANTAKTTFLAHMSHEIRTPMNGVIGMLQLMDETELTEVQRGYARLAHESSLFLLGILNDILDLSKIEAGKISLESVQFGLRSIVGKAASSLKVQADAKGLSLECNVEDGVPDDLEGDSQRLRQVLTNLVSNAIKFTHRGGVTVSVRLEEQISNSAMLRFSVRDTGIGIRPDQANEIFKPFVQADSSTTRKYGGTGLGLAISKEIVELMGGRIGVDSKEGDGSDFWFTAAFAVSREKSRTEDAGNGCPVQKCDIPQWSGPRKTILVADDDPTNRTVLQALLDRLGYSNTVVNNGAEAVEAVQQHEYDLILMDWQMPIMNGKQATRHIRQSKQSGIPIVAVTASAMTRDRQDCIAAGANDYLLKPIDLYRLSSMLNKWLAPEGGACCEPVEERQREPKNSFDEQNLLERLLQNKELASQVLTGFVNDCPNQLERLKRELAAEDGPGVSLHAHKLQGGAATVAAVRLREIALEMEAAAQVGRLDRVNELLPVACDEFSEFRQTVECLEWRRNRKGSDEESNC